MTAKVVIDRENKAARVEVGSVTDAGWLGRKFVARHRHLAIDQDWNIVCYPPGDLLPAKEQYTLDALVGLPWTRTTIWVDAIATWITNPPACSQCGRPL